MWLLTAFGLFSADQLLKKLARQKKLPPISGKIQWTHLENDGFLFGKCRQMTPLTTILPCGAFLAALSALLPHSKTKTRGEKFGMALLLSGGFGNLWDRLRRGSVTDYIRFPHLPTKKLRTLVWNLADFLLLLGAAVLSGAALIRRLRRKDEC